MSTFPRIRFDFSESVGEVYYLLSLGAKDNLRELGINLRVGLRVTLCQRFNEEVGSHVEFVRDGTVDKLEPWGWIVRPDSILRHAKPSNSP